MLKYIGQVHANTEKNYTTWKKFRGINVYLNIVDFETKSITDVNQLLTLVVEKLVTIGANGKEENVYIRLMERYEKERESFEAKQTIDLQQVVPGQAGNFVILLICEMHFCHISAFLSRKFVHANAQSTKIIMKINCYFFN